MRPRRPSEAEGKFAPRRVGEPTFSQIAPVQRIGILAVEGCDPDGSGGHQLTIEELRRVRDPGHSSGGVGQRDQAMGFAAAKARVEAKDRRLLLGPIGQAQEHLAQKLTQPPCRMGVGKELGCRMTDGPPFFMAGLWAEASDPATGEVADTYTLIITATMRVHDRMPVILATDSARRWIEPGPLPAELLVPYPAEEMTAWRVADDAKNSRIEPHPGMGQPVTA